MLYDYFKQRKIGLFSRFVLGVNIYRNISSVVLDLQSNTIYYQDLQSANIFVANNFHLMRNERLVKTDSKS